ncbi:MAG: monovalent cation/H+ antiporter complex subunit F [Egibacteraceae bacterium]
MSSAFLAFALAWATLLLAGGGFALLRARHTIQRILALDLLVTVVIQLLALLAYLRDSSYYLDAALALALLSFVATLAAARHYHEGSPF